MSRRPQVLRIVDSKRRDVPASQMTPERPQTAHPQQPPPLSDEEVLLRMQEEAHVTRRMRHLFEERSTRDAAPIIVAKLGDEDGATLVSEVPEGKVPAFRTLSCGKKDGKTTTSFLGLPQTLKRNYLRRSIPDYLNESCIGVEEVQNLKELQNQSPAVGGGLAGNRRVVPGSNKAAAFDGLLQYLQEYRHGLRELLVNNNVVIIEPVREPSPRRMGTTGVGTGRRTVPAESACRITGAMIKKRDTTTPTGNVPGMQGTQPVLRRHFFYHPRRSNRELLDEELPDPDTVRNARQVFERSLKLRAPAPPAPVVHHHAWTDAASLSSGVGSDLSTCDTDLDSPRGGTASRSSCHRDDRAFSSDDEENADGDIRRFSTSRCGDDEDEGCARHYVAPEVLEKIRACGTCVTYYGGRVISCSQGPRVSPMTLAIMDEIRQRHDGHCNRRQNSCLVGVKFRLVKSNSCGSRLELAGTEEERRPLHSLPGVSEEKTGRVDERPVIVREQVAKVNGTTKWKSDRNETKIPSEDIERALNEVENEQKISWRPKINANVRENIFLVGKKPYFDDMEFEEFEVLEDPMQEGSRKDNDQKGQVVSTAADVPGKDRAHLMTWANRSKSSASDFNNEADHSFAPLIVNNQTS